MENKRSKVFISILLVVLCLSVCVGLTYAYFTDSAKSSGNKIQAGNLKLDLKLYDKVDDEWISIKNTEDPVFNYDKWEPGYTEARHIAVKNEGSLALKYQLTIVPEDEVSELADVIDVYYSDPAVQVTNRTALTEDNKLGTLTQVLAGLGELGIVTLL